MSHLFAGNEVFKENEVWIVTADMENLGKIHFYMLPETTDSCGVLKSLKDRDKVILGNIKAKLFRLFQKRKNKNSMAVIELTEKGKIYFLSMKMSLSDIEKISDDSIKGIIYDGDFKNQLGKLTAVKTKLSSNNLPQIVDYKQVFDSIADITARKIYNPALIKNKKWHKFVSRIESKSAIVQDDLEFMLLFYSNVNKVGFSHYSLVKTNIDLERTLEEPQIECNVLKDSVVYMKFKTLSGRTEEIDSVFNRYANYSTCIIDLRNTSGGKFETTYKLASYLSQKDNPVGAFVCRPYYEDVSFRNKRDNFYVLQKEDFSNFSAVLDEKQAVKIQFKPNRPVQSKIYLLTNKYTASACEPLVHGLKNTGNIQVIGEKTAGAMLSPMLYDIGNDFFLIVPAADYLTNEWTSIEGVGVKPDIEVKSKKALDFVLLHRR